MEINRVLSLYVGNLHPDVDEKILDKEFSALGQIRKIHLCRNSTNDVSLGYAYVTYYSRADAEKALDTMNFKNLMNRPIRIMWANSNSSVRKLGVGNIFIKNLNKKITDEMLYDTFYAFGKILSSKVARDGNNHSKGYGFVHYSTKEEADKAVAMVNGMSVMGKIVFVGPFKSKGERLKELENKSSSNLLVTNFEKKSLNDVEQPGPSSLHHVAKAKPEGLLKKENSKKSNKVSERRTKTGINSAPVKQKVPDRAAVENTSSTTITHQNDNQNLNDNVVKSMPTKRNPSTSGKNKPQSFDGHVNDGQRDRRYYGRKPITLGSFITFMK